MKRLAFIIPLLLLVPLIASATSTSPLFDTSCGNTAVAATSSASCVLTATTTSPVQYAMTQLNSGNDNDAGCTAGGVAMTKIGTVHDTHAGNNTWWYVYTIAGKSGATNFKCSQNVDTNAMRIIVLGYGEANQAMTYSGGGATDSLVVATATTSTSVSSTLTPISANSYIGSFVLQFNDTNTVANTNLTLRQNASSTTAYTNGGDSNGILSGASTQTWATGIAADWSMVQFSISPIAPAAVAGSTYDGSEGWFDLFL